MCGYSHLFFFICFVTISVRPAVTSADPPPGVVVLDGLSVIISQRVMDEADAVPLLHSDVEFGATLWQIWKYGPDGAQMPLDDNTRSAARRRAVLMQILGWQMEQVGESVPIDDIKLLEDKFIERAGGVAAMVKLYSRFGVDETALTTWSKNALLTSRAIAYVAEQVDTPTEKEIIAKMMEKGLYVEGKRQSKLREEIRLAITKERSSAAVNEWLMDVISAGRVRIVR